MKISFLEIYVGKMCFYSKFKKIMVTGFWLLEMA